MRRAKRYRLVAFIALVVAVVAAGGIRWWNSHLSSAERPLVGTWQRAGTGGASGSTRVWRFGANRACRVEEIDPATGQVVAAMDGHWSVADGLLVCDWEGNALARAGRSLPARWTGITDTKLDPYSVESVSDDELVLRSRGGPSPYALRRATGR